MWPFLCALARFKGRHRAAGPHLDTITIAAAMQSSTTAPTIAMVRTPSATPPARRVDQCDAALRSDGGGCIRPFINCTAVHPALRDAPRAAAKAGVEQLAAVVLLCCSAHHDWIIGTASQCAVHSSA